MLFVLKPVPTKEFAVYQSGNLYPKHYLAVHSASHLE